MASVLPVYFWGFFHLVSFLYFWSIFNKTIISLALVGYEMIIAPPPGGDYSQVGESHLFSSPLPSHIQLAFVE